MDCFNIADLTEEVFGHLCNVALNKCNDKGERRKAGCGGRAMRKRVLIKNFVSDLFKMHKTAENEAREEGEILSQDEYDEDEVTGITCEEIDEEIAEIEEDEEDFQRSHQLPSVSEFLSDCWLPSSNENSMLNSANVSQDDAGPFCDFADPLNGRDGALSRADHVSSLSIMGGGVLSLYDVYSGVSERATEGDLPSASDPLGSNSSLMDSVDLPVDSFQSLYEPHFDPTDLSSPDSLCSFAPLTTSPIRAMCESAGAVAPLQPLSTDPGDELFLSLTSNSYSEMKSYSFPLDCPSHVLEPEPVLLTDLDAENDRSYSKKRRSNESYEESLNIAFQKRIKL
ncbi:unnamed protein product [Caenorhabditis auriculariae]|uniref:Uncharacterized protein n=1 Tax=Caenorhabditis auriculariae TaxID=2777116 RepID=A0A8S1GTF4_9PELO|nr:unnamed protein product [Caenorhabditis auriculariae]